MKLDCGHEESPHSDFTTGYGVDSEGHKHCYDCCAKNDRREMDTRGKYTLYLVKREDGYHVTNWPNSLDYKVIEWSKSRHNFGGFRTDVWFRDYRGKKWHGYQIGDYNEVCHVKRLK